MTLEQPQKQVTVAEFEQFLALPENADRVFELIDGEIVEKVPTEEHGLVASNVTIAVGSFVKAHGLGRVIVEARHRAAPDDQHNDRQPDVAFTSADRALPLTTEGAVPQLPDLCVEIQSRRDTPKQMSDKARYHLSNGARVVWLIYPAKRLVEVLTPDERQLLTTDDTLDGDAVLPGFAVKVGTLFEQ